MKIPAAIELVPESRRSVLTKLKDLGHATIPHLAESLAISTEAVRQHLNAMRREGWIAADCAIGEEEAIGRGRPATEYCLTPAAEDLFPKRYAELTSRLFDLTDADQTLVTLTDERVNAVEPKVRGQSLGRRMEALRSIYVADDPYAEVKNTGDGYALVEHNCPYLQFATERPLFCSTTVSALRRLTGFEVVREERFQDGDGKCVFHVYKNSPVTGSRKQLRFEREPAADAMRR